MDPGELTGILSRLILGALASFLAIMLWSRTRDIAWMFIIIGTIMAYAETVFSVLQHFGIAGGIIIPSALVSALSILLPSLPTAFFIAAFAVMVARKYQRR